MEREKESERKGGGGKRVFELKKARRIQHRKESYAVISLPSLVQRAFSTLKVLNVLFVENSVNQIV